MKSSAKTGPNHDSSKSVMEKIPQTEIRCRYSYQTHFTGSHRRSQKTRNSEGFCEDNLPSGNVRAEQSREGRDRPCFQFRYTPFPGRHATLTCLPKSMMISFLANAPGSHQTRNTIPAKRGCCQERLHPHKFYFSLIVLSLIHCFQHLSCRCFLLGR